MLFLIHYQQYISFFKYLLCYVHFFINYLLVNTFFRMQKVLILFIFIKHMYTQQFFLNFQAVKLSLLTECKCHGISGSCTMKTCWKTLPPFRQIGDNLMKKYYRARPVTASSPTIGPRGVDFSPSKKSKKLRLVLKKGKTPIKKVPRKSDLVFLQMSPNYCEKDLAAGSLGTVGRSCNRTSRGRINFQFAFYLPTHSYKKVI